MALLAGVAGRALAAAASARFAAPRAAPIRLSAAPRRAFASAAPAPAAAASSATPLANACHPMPYTSAMEFIQHRPTFPMYRVMDQDGKLVAGAKEPDVTKEFAQRIYRTMLELRTMDNVLYDAQRQGLISFYMTNYNEEAIQVGSAAAWTPDDMLFLQYREAGVVLWRGYGIEDVVNQTFSNALDRGKGRQMPIHFGAKDLNIQTVSSPLATQIPQASGMGYALRMQGKPAICACYFGDGAASEGDFHAGLNIAATCRSRTVFVCRNNGYAISTPTEEQYRGDGIAARGPAYGIPTIRVDGNDVWAALAAARAAREMSMTKDTPVLIEAMTYRGGHHSTSDDSSRYRPEEERLAWERQNNPIVRLRRFMEARSWWTEEQETSVRDATRDRVLAALKSAEQTPKPSLQHMFTDVYAEKPWHLAEQERALHAHLATYGEHYPQNHAKP